MTLKRKKKEMAKRKPTVEKASRLLVKEFEPRTENQKNCVITIAENDLSIINGVAGTGKTCLACGMAASYLCDNKVDKILITRPLVQCGRNGGGLGFLKGDLSDKVLPYMKPIELELKNFLGKESYRTYITQEVIEIVPLELIRGRSLEDYFIVVDEAQNCTAEQLDMICTRIGRGSKMVLTGDLDQTDLPKKDSHGLHDFVNDVKHIKGVGVAYLGIEDIQRSGIVGKIIAARNSAKNKKEN